MSERCRNAFGRSNPQRTVGNLVINNANYRIFGMVMSGYSEYGNEKRGSRVYHVHAL